jgi:hypothetical protein
MRACGRSRARGDDAILKSHAPLHAFACIRAGAGSHVTQCARLFGEEYVFEDADHAAAHYDARARGYTTTARLGACPDCIDIVKAKKSLTLA